MEQAGAAAPPQSFEIFPLIESLADAMQAGAGDAAIQGLVADLVGRFDACFKALQESNSTLPEVKPWGAARPATCPPAASGRPKRNFGQAAWLEDPF
ncbi:hypothetical protein CLOP_g9691 [Closterium sp. NIES-67]|nr:hypothetical protein CLOP_g9691 [Closterium sp. NIES-67]